jgi:hypothetical protein
VQQGGKPKAIARHVPTRFAILHLITLDILASESSLKVMVSVVLLLLMRFILRNAFCDIRPKD